MYRYICKREDCELPNPCYIGHTRNTLQTRLQQHCNDGAIKEHLHNKHKSKATIDELINETESIQQLSDLKRLKIYEALMILTEKPSINRQEDNFNNPLKLYSRLVHNNTQTHITQTQEISHSYNLRNRNIAHTSN